MNQEKLLLKKFNRLNYLKGVLVSRSEEDREAIIEENKRYYRWYWVNY